MSITINSKELAPPGIEGTGPHAAILHETGTPNARLRILRMYGEGAPLPDNQSGAPAIRPLALLALGLIAGLSVNLAQRATAQALTVLHHFTTTVPYTNLDGVTPNGFVVSGNTLYGTTQAGGSQEGGTVFRV